MSQKVKFHKGPVWYVVQLVILADGNIEAQKKNYSHQLTKKANEKCRDGD